MQIFFRQTMRCFLGNLFMILNLFMLHDSFSQALLKALLEALLVLACSFQGYKIHMRNTRVIHF